jgi:signal transduction histidine kinase/BarA-like signal transduction histidine kinase
MRNDKEGQARGLWILALCLAASLTVAGLYYRTVCRQSLKNIERIRTIYTERTENLINSVFHKTDVLAAVVKLENGDISKKTFEDIAKIVYTKNSGIRGIQYMPDAVVTYSYPLKGNEEVIGKNFLKIPERKKDVELAINTRSIALSGPYHLIQGGLGVVARNPVFLTDSSGQEYFWGFSAIILDLPDALESAGLARLPESGYDFQLYCVNENGERLIIAGDKKLDLSRAVKGGIQVPHHKWTLAVVERAPWVNVVKSLGILAAGVFLSLIIWQLYCVMLQEKAAVRAKDRFFSDISHDMRTPLNAVIGFSALAQMPDLTPGQKDAYLEKIQSAGQLMLDLVNDTLTISKGSSGKLTVQSAPVDTELLGESILDPIRAMAEQKGVTLTVDCTGCRHRVILADRLNVQKLFLNLLNNAVKYTPAGGHVSVTVADDPPGGTNPDTVAVIRDDGIGIRPEFLPHLFEPFAQEQRKGYEGQGTGLGLAIVRQVVDLLNGSISVESREGQGTAFTVRLHFEEVPSAEKTAPQALCAADTAILAGKKVLLCEDNAMNRQIACTLLENVRMAVVTAENGQAGVDRFSQSREGEFDLVLMDIRMPVMDGFAAARAIRSMNRPDAAAVPIIAMTADVFPEDVQKCLDAGMNDHLAKPIDVQKMMQVLCGQLQAAASAGEKI